MNASGRFALLPCNMQRMPAVMDNFVPDVGRMIGRSRWGDGDREEELPELYDLSAGSDHGGERAAARYSLIETAKLNGVDPEAYLRDIHTCIADHSMKRIGELLP